MDTETIDPRFMKALIRCYLLQEKAKRRVFYNRRFFRQVLKVYKWQNKIKSNIEASKIFDEEQSFSNKVISPPPKDQVDSVAGNEKICIKEERNSTQTLTPPQTANDEPSGNIHIVSRDLVTTTTPPRTVNEKPQASFDDVKKDSTPPPTTITPENANDVISADSDIVRRNLWLMIVRQDIAQAYRRKVSFREQKILKSRAIAQRCQLHSKEFYRLNQKQHDGQEHLQKSENKHEQD